MAKNNPANKKTEHFAHHSGQECQGAIETTLHLLAKAVLKQTKKLKTPRYHYDYDPNNEKTVFKEGQNLLFDKIILEEPIEVAGGKFIPDAIGEIKGKRVLIEFANTHFVDEYKKSKLKETDYSCIEINLAGQILNEDTMTAFLQSETPLKYWISNKRYDKEYLKELTKETERQQKIQAEQRIQEEKHRLENESKWNKYKGQKEHQVFKADDFGRVNSCPLKKNALKKEQLSSFYSHPVLQKIIDGQFWNGVTYGCFSYGKHIYFRNKKITVFPPDNETVTPNENRENKFFYAGLKKIEEILHDPQYGDCQNCPFYIDTYNVSDSNYNVCAHTTKEEK